MGAIPQPGVHPDRTPGDYGHVVESRCPERGGRDDLGRTRRHRHSCASPSGRLYSHRHLVQPERAGSGRSIARENARSSRQVVVRGPARMRYRERRTRRISAGRSEPSQRGGAGDRASVQGAAHLCRRSWSRRKLGREAGLRGADLVRIHARSRSADDDREYRRRRCGSPSRTSRRCAEARRA